MILQFPIEVKLCKVAEWHWEAGMKKPEPTGAPAGGTVRKRAGIRGLEQAQAFSRSSISAAGSMMGSSVRRDRASLK